MRTILRIRAYCGYKVYLSYLSEDDVRFTFEEYLFYNNLAMTIDDCRRL